MAPPARAANTAEVIEFLWSGQKGFFELGWAQGGRFRRRVFTKREALSLLAGADYFSPLARKARGSKKHHVADVGNVLWADVDELDDLEERLRRLPPRPSVILSSGKKGYWLFWKLSEPIHTDEIELWNHSLSHLLEADHTWYKNTLARLPGSYRPDTGRHAQVVAFSKAIYEPAELAFLQQAPDQTNASSQIGASSRPSCYVPFPEMPRLSWPARQYITAQQPIPYRQGGTYDRSAEEYKILLALIYQGWTDELIIHFADVAPLPRHRAERERRGDYSWTTLSLQKARDYADQHPARSQEREPTAASPDQGAATIARHQQRRQALSLVHGQTTTELIAEIMDTLRASRAKAYRILATVTRSGYVRRERRGRIILNHLTDAGREQLRSTSWFVPILDASARVSPPSDLPNS